MKAKSRLKAYKRKKNFEYFVCWMVWIVLMLWIAVAFSFQGMNNEVEAFEYKKPIIIEKVDHSLTEKEQIFNYIVEVFGEDAADAITIINKCENHSFDPKAENWNRNGTWDAGIFQVNQVHGYSMEQMKDWKQNIDAAKKIFDASGWSAWSCSEHVGVTPFWK